MTAQQAAQWYLQHTRTLYKDDEQDTLLDTAIIRQAIALHGYGDGGYTACNRVCEALRHARPQE